MNEEYLISKMYPSGFASYIELTKKSTEFMTEYPNVSLKIIDSAEMKQATKPASEKITIYASGNKFTYANQ